MKSPRGTAAVLVSEQSIYANVEGTICSMTLNPEDLPDNHRSYVDGCYGLQVALLRIIAGVIKVAALLYAFFMTPFL